MKKYPVVIIIALLHSAVVTAQPRIADEQGNLLYRDYELLVNPATAGADSAGQLSLGVQKQWMSINDAPLAQCLQYQTPLAQNSGMGAWANHSAYGIAGNLQIGAVYAYKIPLKSSVLSLGLSLSALMLYESRVTDLNDPQDPVFAEPLGNQFGFNAGFGAYYAAQNFYAGVSIPQLLTNDVKDNTLHNSIAFARMQYYLTAGYRFDPTSRISLSPSALLQWSGATAAGYAFMLTAAYNRRVEIGAGWSFPAQLQLSAGAAITKRLSLRYQFSQDAGSGYHAGMSHFVVLRFAWGERKKTDAEN